MKIPEFKDIEVTPEMIKAGEELSALMVDATCEKSMGGLGGCRYFNIENYPVKYRQFILDYIYLGKSSVEVIYKAMRKRRKNEII